MDLIDGEFLAGLLENSLVDGELGAVLAVVSGPNGEVAFASTGSDPEGVTPSVGTPIRMASISKLFLASTTLTLVDEGLLDLDEPIETYVSSISIHPDITARDLLQHSSGLTEYATGDEFLVMLVEDPARRWTVGETLGLVSTVR